ncbi:catalase [Bradyrhizobium sp. 5.13L]
MRGKHSRQPFCRIPQVVWDLEETPCALPQRCLVRQYRGPALPKLFSGAASPASIVAAMRKVAGLSRKTRASFASGRCVRGTYVPSDQASAITRSVSFTKPSRVLARFSVDEGFDNKNTMLRGFSFRLGSAGQHSEIFTQNAPVHFARTADQMFAYLQAHFALPDGKPDVEKINSFSAANPETLNQANYIATHPPAESFASTTYWGVHAFPATNAKGETRFIKFRIDPVGERAIGPKGKLGLRPAALLHDDLECRIAAREIRFSVMALLDRPGDPVMDVTVRWPDEDYREAARLGTIVITGVEANDACDEAEFSPATLAEGIGYPPDEMFAARRATYRFSLRSRR